MTLAGDDRATAVSGDGQAPPAAMPSVAPGQIVGRFRLLRPLGKGAMGIVYLAHDPDLDRNVALKFVRSVGGRSAVRRRARMLREARAMACLSHRNVVGVLDVGLHAVAGSDEPLLFIAMEYVAAEPLTAWLRRERGPGEVLRVFLAAGRGLAAAHAAGLVHRDFKPDNVLVGEARAVDGHRAAGEVKVTDFGLACARRSTQGSGASSEGADESEPRETSEPAALDPLIHERLTRTGAATGTPAYMAPEQHLRQSVDERADQFAFCVALYEALYGQSPFEGTNADQRARSVVAGAVIRPVRMSGLRRRVWPIVRRGLMKQPVERWPSMDALLEVLEAAASPRWPRWAVLGGGVGVALVAGLTAGSFFSRPGRCRASEGELTGVWDDVRRQQVRAAVLQAKTPHAAETWSRLAAMLDAYAASWSDVYNRICDPARPVEEVSATFDRAMACVADRRSRLEALVTLLDDADEQTVSAAVRAASGLPAVTACADPGALSAEVSPPDDEATRARVRSIRADLASVDTLLELGRVREALEALERMRMAADRVDYPPVMAETLLRLGQAHARAGEATAARNVLEQAYFIATESSDTQTATRAAIDLARVMGVLRQDYETGLEWARHAQAGLERLRDDGALEGSLLAVMGSIHQDRNQLEQARNHFERALAITENLHGPDHVETANALNSMGVLAFKTGDYDRAVEYLTRGLKAYENALGRSHPGVGMLSGNLGLLARQHGELDDAHAYFERAIDVLEKAHGPSHFGLAGPLNNLALVHQQRGEHEAALGVLERALAIVTQAHGEQHPHVALVLSNIAWARLSGGDAIAAEQAARQAVSIHESALGAEHPKVAMSLSLLAEALLEQGRAPEAIVAAEQTLASFAPGELVLWTHDALARWVLARALVETGQDRARALELAAAAAERYDAAQEPAFSRADEIRDWLRMQ